MLHPNNLDSYLASEMESERCRLVSGLVQDTQLGAGRAGWYLLAMSPSRLERVSLATSLNLREFPDALWTLCSYLLGDSEQDVVGNAINAMTHSRVRSFAHRSFHYLQSPERPQRVLYCLARYCEEAHDGRIAEALAPTLASDLSDAFLARTFNALYRHGIKSNSALQVARELLVSHVDATNMDRKAAVAALTYLFFAGNNEIIGELRILHQKVSIPELRRLLHWGLREVDHLCISDNEGKANICAKRFWAENLLEPEPNFTGYGCFKDEDLLAALQETIENSTEKNSENITRTILKTGNKACIEWLSKHPHLGIRNNIASQPSRECWRQLCPTGITGMTEQLQDPQSALRWLQDSPEALVIHASEDLLKSIVNNKSDWFSAIRTADCRTSLNVLLGMILAAEYLISCEVVSAGFCRPFLSEVLSELEELAQNRKNTEDVAESILSCLIGSTLDLREIESLRWKLMGDINWSHIALTHLHPNIEDLSFRTLACFDNIARKMNSEPLSDEQIIDLSRTTALALLSSNSQLNEQLAQKVLQFESCLNVLDPNSNVEGIGHPRGADGDDGEESDVAATDWSGHVVVDRPVARWGTILLALKIEEIENYCEISQAKKDEIEARLKEAMGTAKHVEKRWIVRALARLGTDEAIKALLYQGLQHIDSEFVSHVIRELLPSSHPRAQQALIRCVGRNAISDDLKLSILDEISTHNPQEVLQELRTLEILRLPTHIDDAVRDAVGRVAALLDEKETENSGPMVTNVVDLSGQDVDATIRSQLALSDALTIDARSALRTAEMILLQSRSWTQSGMDLSPIVNMHFKAVELVLRDTFEPFTDALLRRGQISRKLDILGYARPIPEKMQIFEDFLASLPVVKTIPYFSKFKLRKMLRGVCLYRPGKRFTLDGPKAFALFFLVTSRLNCQFGLEKMLPLGFSTDVELFEYIKLIHSLQDSRNRAVHEGLTWDAKDDIESMRAQAFKVIDMTLRIKKRAALPQETQDRTQKSGIGVGA